MYKPLSLTLNNIGTHEHTVYAFREGVPTLIVGKNEDDPSQKGNGSGKSFLMEGVALAIIGSPARDATNKEIIRRGCSEGSVQFKMYNTMYRCEVTINRKFSAKAAEVTLFIDGEQVVKSDVNEYNKEILNLLAISKEDFLNFYMLNAFTYKPFLRVGDTKKKEIVNRFSGADKTDAVKEFIDIDVKEAQTQVDAVQKQIDINTGKQEIIGKQIEDEEKKFSEEGIAEQVAAKEEELVQALDDAEAIDLEGLKGSIADLETKIGAINTEEFDSDIEEAEKLVKEKEDAIIKKQEELPVIEKKFQAERDRIDANKKAVNAQTISAMREELKGFQKEKADLDKQLMGLIVCPKCDHKFLAGDKVFNHADAVAKQHELNDTITAYAHDIEQDELAHDQNIDDEEKLKNDIAAAQTELRQQISTLQDEKSEGEDIVRELKNDKKAKEQEKVSSERVLALKRKELESSTATQEKLIQRGEEINGEIEALKSAKSTKQEALETQLLELVDEGSDLLGKLEEALANVRSKEEWHTNFKNFKSFLANQSLKTIEDYTNMYLQKMGTNLSIAIQGYRVMSNKKLKEEINISVLRDNLEEASYGTFSGGERARIDVAVILAIQSLINLNATSGGIDLLFIDEVLDSVDGLGMQTIIEGLRNVGRTVLIVSQVEINALKEDTLVVQKKNKISTLL